MPSTFPIFQRHRWCGAEESLQAVGLLLCIHLCFQNVVSKWAGKQEVLATVDADAICDRVQDAQVDGQGFGFSSDDADDELESAANPAAKRRRGKSSVYGGQSQPKGSAPAGEFNWQEHNQRLRGDACLWAASDPEPTILVLLMAMGPLIALMYGILALASQKWDVETARLIGEGKSARYRVLECHSGRYTLRFSRMCRKLFQDIDVWKCLPHRGRTMKTRALAFKLIARSCAAVSENLEMRWQAYPYRFFAAIQGPKQAAAVAAGRTCVLDEFGLAMRSVWPTAAALASAEAPMSFNWLVTHSELGNEVRSFQGRWKTTCDFDPRYQQSPCFLSLEANFRNSFLN